MHVQVFTIFDIKANTHGQPFTSNNIATASRTVAEAVNDPERHAMFSRQPDDFLLYHIGSFDDDEGRLIPLDNNVIVCKLSDFTSPKV